MAAESLEESPTAPWDTNPTHPTDPTRAPHGLPGVAGNSAVKALVAHWRCHSRDAQNCGGAAAAAAGDVEAAGSASGLGEAGARARRRDRRQIRSQTVQQINTETPLGDSQLHNDEAPATARAAAMTCDGAHQVEDWQPPTLELNEHGRLHSRGCEVVHWNGRAQRGAKEGEGKGEREGEEEGEEQEMEGEGNAGAARSRSGSVDGGADDDILYDPLADDEDEKFVAETFRAGEGKTATAAILSCPGCFTPVCYQCQEHELYKTQYRALEVVNCTVAQSSPVLASSVVYSSLDASLASRSSLLRPPPSAVGQRAGRGSDQAPAEKSSNADAHGAVPPKPAGQPLGNDHVLWPVACATCHAVIGYQDPTHDGVVHFF
eukprot:GHVT01077929.1.p1 GENE.GHVT01077929.1~~GHVT01077929.1.p1  ORF type:complete len:376 (+),score=93.78 GHVT01077929.1:833-1960(+)